MDPPFGKTNRWKGVSAKWTGGKYSLDFRLTAELFLILVQSSNVYRLIRS